MRLAAPGKAGRNCGRYRGQQQPDPAGRGRPLWPAVRFGSSWPAGGQAALCWARRETHQECTDTVRRPSEKGGAAPSDADRQLIDQRLDRFLDGAPGLDGVEHAGAYAALIASIGQALQNPLRSNASVRRVMAEAS